MAEYEATDFAKGSRTAIGVGMATLVTVMVAVILTTFSVLALVSARSDLNYSNKAAAATQAYYNADSQAVAWLAKAENVLQGDANSWSVGLSQAGFDISSTANGAIMLSEVFGIDATRDLSVEVVVQSNGTLEILKWQITTR